MSAAPMDIDPPTDIVKGKGKETNDKPRFEVKKVVENKQSKSGTLNECNDV